MSEWDKYYRWDRAVKRAVEATPLAEELYEIAAVLDSMFGCNAGKDIFKVASDDAARSLHVPGETRKYASLTKEPGNITDNLRSYARALRARTEWKRSGHGTYSLDYIADFGRRLVAANLVACSILFQRYCGTHGKADGNGMPTTHHGP